MKKIILSSLLLAGLAVAPLSGQAEEKKADKPKPYPLDTCIVSGEKLGEGGMKTYTFTYEGQEVKLCCKSCEKDFKKEPSKYMDKIKEAAAKKKPAEKK